MAVDGRSAAATAAAATVAVIVALGIERTSLQKRLTRGASFHLIQSGPGAERAARAACAALASGARALVSWGLAGGLASSVATGAVLLPRRVRELSGASFDADPAWHAALARSLGGELAPHVEDLVSVPTALTTPEQKNTAATAGAVAADMESAAIAAVAARAGAPFVALRVVVDGVGDSLPADAERWIDARGDRRLAPALAAAFQPAQWRELLILAQRYRVARRALERLAAAVASTGFCLPDPR